MTLLKEHNLHTSETNRCGSERLPHYVTLRQKRLATIRRQDTTFLLSFQPSQAGLCTCPTIDRLDPPLLTTNANSWPVVLS